MNGAKLGWAAGQLEPFQMRVRRWVITCFGHDKADDCRVRTHRFLEEAIELAQSTGCARGDAHALVDYIYSRPVGEPRQEVGGVQITLAGLCAALGINADAEGERELARVWANVEAIRAKAAAKPPTAALPRKWPELLPALKRLRHAYVALMESGRDRIMDLGGQCDPVDVMERGDPELRLAREAIEAAEALAS